MAVPRGLLAVGWLLTASAGWAQSRLQPEVLPPQPVPVCATCHGQLGLGNAPDAPHLAGQPKLYLIAQLKAFRSGLRRHEVMNVIAKPLSDEQIEAASEWFSTVQLEVRRP